MLLDIYQLGKSKKFVQFTVFQNLSYEESFMRKSIYLSVATAIAIATPLCAADDLASAFKEGKVTGSIKSAYLTTHLTDVTATVPADASAFAIGGKLKFETAPLAGFSAGAEFMTTNDMGMLKDGSKTAQIFGGTAGIANQDDPTLLMNDGSGSVLGQAYIQYAIGKTLVKVGRQELDTPLAGPKETRMLPTTFQAAVVINKDLPDTTLIGAVVTGQKERQSDQFVTMGRAALQNSTTDGTGTLGGGGKTGGTSAASDTALAANNATSYNNALDSKVYALAAIYGGIPGLTLQAWDYQATDILNAVYLQADYSVKTGGATVFAAAQYLKESDIGSFKTAITGVDGIDSSLMGIKAGIGMSGAKLTAAYTKVSDSTATKYGGIVAPWDGTPAFTDSANNNNLPGTAVIDGVATIYGGSYAAGSKNMKVQADYDFAELGIKGLTCMVSYAKYDRQYDAARLATKGYDVTEMNIMAKYAFAGSLKGLSLMGMIIPMDVTTNGGTQTTTGTTSDRTQYRGFVTYNF
jgi:hypothetical protein